MTKYTEVSLVEFFELKNGHPRFIKEYIDSHSGAHPVYSASLTKPFGFVNEFDFEGHYLTWVMNGYGGRVQEVSGKFSANRDRGVFVPRKGKKIPDLTYLRFVAEPQLTAAAVGRRVDGRQNEYTKIYPDAASSVVIQLPIDQNGGLDFARMTVLGEKFRRIEAAQSKLKETEGPLRRAVFSLDVLEPNRTVNLSDADRFSLSIGKRILRINHSNKGVPAYSANARTPFGNVPQSNLADFDEPSLLWGIDGNFDWNYVPAGQRFATTDHCGRLQVLDKKIDPEYAYWYLRSKRSQYGFDRVYRASLQNIKAEVAIVLPVDEKSGEISLRRQRRMAEMLRKQEEARLASLTALHEVLTSRVSFA